MDWTEGVARVKTTANVEGLFILLRGDLLDLDKEFVVELNGQESWRGVPRRRLDVLVSTSRHGDPLLTFEARVPVAK